MFLRAIGNDHSLMNLILRCINNDPRRRAHASEIVERLSAMKSQFPSSFANRLEMLRQIERQEEEKRALSEEGSRRSRTFNYIRTYPFRSLTVANLQPYCMDRKSAK